MGMTILTIASCIAWIAYGAVTNQPLQVINNVLFSVGWVVVIVVAVKFDGLKTSRAVTACIVSVLVAAAAQLLGGAAALATLATVCMLVGRWPQTVESWRYPGGLGVSIEAFALNVVVSALWFAFGVAHGDGWIAGTSLYAALHSSFVVVRTIQGRRAALLSVADVEPFPQPEILRAAG